MALKALDAVHAQQIQAGTTGRKKGHKFEDQIATRINQLAYPISYKGKVQGNLFNGSPAELLLNYICSYYKISEILAAKAVATGALATSEAGKKSLTVNGMPISKCKSDLIIQIETKKGTIKTVGVSIKQCNNAKPTNAQLYFTTAAAFTELLRKNSIKVSDFALNSLKQFCGEVGFRPEDNKRSYKNRKSDPRRFFWEEIEKTGKAEWEKIFRTKQDEISLLLLQKAYLNDPFPPDFLLHKTKRAKSSAKAEVAIYQIDELVKLSKKYSEFNIKLYRVKKGSYIDPVGVQHEAPRFGIIQMQRGGAKTASNPTSI